jgi:hypothetical protein
MNVEVDDLAGQVAGNFEVQKIHTTSLVRGAKPYH